MIKEERVLINGAVTKSSWHVTTGEQISMLLHKAGPRVAEDIPFQVLYEDDVLLALCKPSGVLVHPSRGHKTGTLYNGLLHYYREHRSADPSFHIGTVHRLDEETSGVMVYALCKKAHKELTRQFENRLVKKTYLCLAHGRAEFTETEVDAPLGTDPENRLAVAAFGLEPRSALTKFVRVAVSPCGNFSLLRAHPFTGRTHQIRVHAKHLGLPLVGDPLYGGRKEDPAFGGLVARVFLHAEALHVAHPQTLVPLVLTAPPPPDLHALLSAVGLGDALK
jgi:23S rRNA pseudouridine1911/1915/1917 synthase